MTLEQMLAAKRAEAAVLREKALTKSADFTAEDATRAKAIGEEIGVLEKRIADAKEAAKSLGDVMNAVPFQSSTDNDEQPGAKQKVYATVGDAFVDSEAYKSFNAAYPHGVGKDQKFEFKAAKLPVVRDVVTGKASTINSEAQGNARAVRTGEVDDLVFRPEPGILDLISTGTTALDWFQYRQIISKTNNAAIVPEAVTNDGVGIAGGVKPLSTLTTTTAEARGFNYADGMEVTNKELSDDGIMRSLINETLTQNIRLEIERVLLHGAGTPEEPAGLFNTPGVLQQAFAVDAPTSIRKGITRLRTTSGAPIQGVLMNAEDDEAWDLMKDLEGRYIGAGPYATGLPSAWGYRRIVSPSVPVGQAVIGDFKTIFFLAQEALSVVAFNQHKDYAQRNLTYVRAEQRGVQLIRNAARLCIVDLAAGA